MALRRLLKSSLKLRMTMLVILLVLAASLIVASVALSLVEKDMQSVIGDQQFARMAGMASTLDEQLRARQSLLRSVAEDLPADARAEPAALQAFLAGRVNLNQQFSNIVAFNMRGMLVASMRPSVQERARPYNDRPYFVDTVAKGAGVISAPFKSRLSGNPVLLLTEPVFDSAGKMVFIIAAALDLDKTRMFDEIAKARPGKSGFMFIMTSKGILVNHPTRARLLEHIHAKPGMNRATDRALAGFEGWLEAPNKEGSPGIYSYKRLTSTDWIVAARFPSDEAFAPIRRMRLRVLFASALLAAGAGLLGWMATRRALAPLELLRRQALLVRDGATDIRELQLDREDEIGELSGAIYALVAQREAAQARIVASEALTRDILERAPDAFVSCDADGKILEWNARAEDTFGWSRAEALGRDVAELLIPPAMRAAHRAGMTAFAGSGTGPIINSRIRVLASHRDGRSIPVELSVGSLPHGQSHIATAFLHDVTERIAFEEAIAAGVKRVRMIADAMPALIAYIDRDLKYQFTNARHQAMLGIDPATMIGRHLGEVLSPATCAMLREPIRRAMDGVSVETELAAGDARYYMAHFIPDFGADGAVAGCYAMVMDISERKSAELRQAASERQAEAANLAKTEFVANISHEIRTPLNAVLGITHLLGKTSLQPEQRHYLDMVRTSGAALLTILNDVLDFSKIEAGRMELSAAPFQLSDVLDAVATIMTVNAGDKPLALSIGVEAAVPASLCGDALRLQQVLINLAGNAIKFTRQGAVRLEVRQSARDGERAIVRFSVHDTGIGISEDERARLFTAFSQADASTTRRFGGTGLGLAICRRLGELMHGTLDVASTPGQGSTFSFELPLQVAAPAQRPPFQRLLLLSACADSGAYLRWLAAAWGWETDCATSLADALAASARRAQAGAPYSAILFDWELAGVAPQAALRALRAANPAPAPAILLMSPRARGHYAQQDEPEPHSVTVLKPINAAAILDALASVPAAPALAPAPAPAPALPLRDVRVLLVEDNPLNQFVARGVLEHAGAVVESASDGQQALLALGTAPERFALILMDVQMPGMDGFAATRAIRQDLGLRVPIIAMSAGVLAFEREQCRTAGMDDFVAKPLDVDDMLTCLLHHLPAPPKPSASFDMAPLLRQVPPGQRRMLVEVVARMVAQAPAELAAIQVACHSDAPAPAAKLLHQMRGSVGTLGARAFADATLALEALVKGGGAHAPIQDALERVERELGLTLELAGAWLAAEAGAESPPGAAEGAPPAAPLARFEQLLRDRDIDACEVLAQCRPYFAATHGAPFADAMDQHMAGLDFGAALDMLKTGVHN
jgi:two-component system sensor histidine kinase/response regulator